MHQINWTKHAKERVAGRMSGLVTKAEIEAAIRKNADAILKAAHKGIPEVKVVVKPLKSYYYLEDGSNGDLVVVPVTPAEMKIRTVMLTRSNQVRKLRKVA